MHTPHLIVGSESDSAMADEKTSLTAACPAFILHLYTPEVRFSIRNQFIQIQGSTYER